VLQAPPSHISLSFLSLPRYVISSFLLHDILSITYHIISLSLSFLSLPRYVISSFLLHDILSITYHIISHSLSLFIFHSFLSTLDLLFVYKGVILLACRPSILVVLCRRYVCVLCLCVFDFYLNKDIRKSKDISL
jgi:hypothetical protein